MSPSEVGTVMQQTLYTLLVVGGPIIVASMVVGLAVSVIQAATQINEATLTFVPKLVVTALILLIFGNAIMGQLLTFTRLIFQTVAEGGR